MNMLDALRLELEWGADEALLDAPQDRRAATPVVTAQPTPPKAKPPSLALPEGPADAARLAAGCDTLEALQAAMAAFTGCALRDTATQLVFADGNPEAKLLLVGEAPGAEEDRAGRPFVGPAGQLLDKMLASIGRDRGNTRIINVVPWRPPGNRKPEPAEVELCLPFITRHIELVDPAVLLLLGGASVSALLARTDSITRLRGGFIDYSSSRLARPIPAMPTFHPAYLLRTPLAKREVWRDLLLVRQKLDASPY